MLSTLAGWARILLSETSAAAVTCAIMKPEFSPDDGVKRPAALTRVRVHQLLNAALRDAG